MILDPVQPSSDTIEDLNKSPTPSDRPEDAPPAYSSQTPPIPSSPPSRTLSLSRNRQGVAPFSAPINGLNIYTKREAIRGSWSLDPLAPQVPEPNLVQMFLDGRPEKKKWWRRSRPTKAAPPTTRLTSRHGSIQATFRVVGDSENRSIATVHTETRKGNIVLDLVSIAPMRTVHIDAYSRRGSITLFVPRSFCGLIQLSSRHGPVEVLPALAASGRVISTKDKETTVLLGDGPMPEVGSDYITDAARIRTRHGRVSLGFSGEDHVIEPPKFMDQAIHLMQRLMSAPSQKSISQ